MMIILQNPHITQTYLFMMITSSHITTNPNSNWPLRYNVASSEPLFQPPRVFAPAAKVAPAPDTPTAGGSPTTTPFKPPPFLATKSVLDLDLVRKNRIIPLETKRIWHTRKKEKKKKIIVMMTWMVVMVMMMT